MDFDTAPLDPTSQQNTHLTSSNIFLKIS